MPTYDYRCRKCGHVFEVFHGIRDDVPRRCPKCRARAQRVPTGGAGLLFKGHGFYITDYRSKTYREKARQERSGGGGGASGGATGGSAGGASSGPPAPGKPGGKTPSAG
jgi:putative FmdB family regulatory protein